MGLDPFKNLKISIRHIYTLTQTQLQSAIIKVNFFYKQIAQTMQVRTNYAQKQTLNCGVIIIDTVVPMAGKRFRAG